MGGRTDGRPAGRPAGRLKDLLEGIKECVHRLRPLHFLVSSAPVLFSSNPSLLVLSFSSPPLSLMVPPLVTLRARKPHSRSTNYILDNCARIVSRRDRISFIGDIPSSEMTQTCFRDSLARSLARSLTGPPTFCSLLQRCFPTGGSCFSQTT